MVAIDATTDGLQQRPDAQLREGDAGPDSASALDATTASIDATVSDAAAFPDAAVGCDSVQVTSTGKTCFGDESSGRYACPEQQCFAREHRAVANIVSAPMTCLHSDGCKVPGPNYPVSQYAPTHDYRFDSQDLRVSLSFDRTLLTELTLERLRMAFVYGAVAVRVDVEGRGQQISPDSPDIQILGFDAGVLHVRFTGAVNGLSATFEDTPHLCYVGHGPTICTLLFCYYSSADASSAGTLEADVKITMAPLLP